MSLENCSPTQHQFLLPNPAPYPTSSGAHAVLGLAPELPSERLPCLSVVLVQRWTRGGRTSGGRVTENSSSRLSHATWLPGPLGISPAPEILSAHLQVKSFRLGGWGRLPGHQGALPLSLLPALSSALWLSLFLISPPCSQMRSSVQRQDIPTECAFVSQPRVFSFSYYCLCNFRRLWETWTSLSVRGT